MGALAQRFPIGKTIMNTTDKAKSGTTEEFFVYEKYGVKEGMNEQIQDPLPAPVVKREMNNENTSMDRDFKKASRLNRKQRLKRHRVAPDNSRNAKPPSPDSIVFKGLSRSV